jgi:hypothetical protein
MAESGAVPIHGHVHATSWLVRRQIDLAVSKDNRCVVETDSHEPMVHGGVHDKRVIVRERRAISHSPTRTIPPRHRPELSDQRTYLIALSVSAPSIAR